MILLSLLQTVSVGCRGKDRHRPDPPPVWSEDARHGGEDPESLYLNPPQMLPLVDESCTPGEAVDRFDADLHVWQWQTGGVGLLPGSGLNLTSMPHLSGQVIAGTRHGMDVRDYGWCRMEPGGYCADIPGPGVAPPSELRSPGSPVVLCRADGDYIEMSVEATSLTGASLVEEAWNHYQNMNGAIAPAPKLTLQVHPRFDTYYKVVNPGENDPSGFIWSLTDNAAWGILGGERLLLIFPRGKRSFTRGINGNLWQIPFVMAHELGHHVFDVHLTALRPEVSGNAFAGFTPRIRRLYPDTLSLQQAGAGDHRIAHEMSWRALGEGFADLFAFYAGGQDESAIDAITFLKEDRNLRYNRFRDGTEKILDPENLDRFLHSRWIPAGTDWTDEHVVGAVWAYGVYDLLGGSDGEDLLLAWLDGLVKHISQPPAAAGKTWVFQQALLALLEIAEPVPCAPVQHIFGPLLQDDAAGDELVIRTIQGESRFACAP